MGCLKSGSAALAPLAPPDDDAARGFLKARAHKLQGSPTSERSINSRSLTRVAPAVLNRRAVDAMTEMSSGVTAILVDK